MHNIIGDLHIKFIVQTTLCIVHETLHITLAVLHIKANVQITLCIVQRLFSFDMKNFRFKKKKNLICLF